MPAKRSPHRIHLRGPWDVRPHASDGPAGRMTMPGTLGDGGWAGFRGRVSFYRRFGRPSNLGPGETVWLAFECVVGAAQVRLNGESLGTVERTGRFDVTGRLMDRNTLTVTFDAVDDTRGVVGNVVLEIIPPPA
jgi:glycosyl hydrolase family 2